MFLILFLFFISSGNRVQSDDDYERFFQTSRSQGLQLFSGLEEIKRYFRENETSLLAKKILDTFEKECMFMEDTVLPQDRKRKPFIVIEGNHRPSRNVVGMRLAKLMGGRFLVPPAPCLAKFVEVLPRGTLLKRAFHLLSLYALAFNVKVHLNLSRTVVMNGYWLDQLVFHIIQSFPSGPFPPVSSDVFKFPHDLLRPDVIFYLDIPDSLQLPGMTTRKPINWKPRALSLYSDLQSRFPIVFQRLTGVYRSTTDAIYQYLHEHLSETRDVYAFHRNIDFDYADRRGRRQRQRGPRTNRTNRNFQKLRWS